MNTVVFEIGGTSLGAYVLQADIWQETLNGVGRWEVICDPAAGLLWPAIGAINTDAQVRIRINGVTMMRGYIDDVLPFLDSTGEHTRLYKITGRSRGIDLAQHYVTAEYDTTRADLVVAALLGIIPSEPALALVGPAPGNINYEADRTFLADAVRDVANLVGYDFYVDNTNWPAAPSLNFFGPGASASGGLLVSIAGNVNNNILRLENGEEVGFNIKNYVEGHAGSLQDHYTDMNAANWTPLAGCTITNENTAPAPPIWWWLNGKSSIRCQNTSGGLLGLRMDLTFPRYSHTVLDMSEPSMASYNYMMHDTRNAIKRCELLLRDTLNNEIGFRRGAFLGLAKCFNCTDQPTNDEWRKVEFPIGDEAGIEAAAVISTKGEWYYNANPAPPFRWANVDRIRIANSLLVNDDDYFLLDGLQFPNVEVISVQQDAPSIAAYGQRMAYYYRPDIKNQLELDAFATSQLNRTHDPKETLRLTTTGQTATPFAAQTIDVVAPTFGIGGPLIGNTIVYRIMRLHHRVVKSSAESEEEGYSFTTEYDLIRNIYEGTAITQYVDHTRVIATSDPDESMFRSLRLTERYRQKGIDRRLAP